LLVKKQNRKQYRKNAYKARPMWRRYDLKKQIAVGVKMLSGLVLVFLLSTVYTFVYGVFTQCSYFKAHNIEITGIHHLSEETILEQASLFTGINILSVNLPATRKRLLAHPDIEDADVARKLPTGLIIGIKEHEPLAVIDLGRRFLIDLNGKIYKECKGADQDDLPLISGLNFSDLGLSGKNVDDPYVAVMNILRMGRESESILPNSSIRKISVDREVGLTLYADGRTKAIKLGYGDYADKYRRLENVTLYLKKRHQVTDFDFIDLVNSGRIVVNPISEKAISGKGKEV
jgi:cell division protein FtsQ